MQVKTLYGTGCLPKNPLKTLMTQILKSLVMR